ncbi:putative 2-amino-4-hydroxy-6-hydroxymethyldihydropteridine pyrophosphokinase [Octadecabacter antarcticus 307]|uniref:2-amino-4-hydroxy-6-hydroxymethyldihydropteridine pyrophosphokinase n=1 Tax=Octadecabacter antarcticus 307 TaxID=391626 RepID=M9R6V3_9RHOB|nr:2-amino-4-hydroxy-6-hydroxymethyldihydropteridine diphosphokinase [Octadecabacter antarcticus]AGI66051.1 putative 2-amino-4-hydroxy-6-hydroxymethyldihydropteridine pyrophosphokinase [Octadecabacter antarcticus 307]
MAQGELNENGVLVLVAMGGNAPSHVGDPHATILSALTSMRMTFGDVAISNFYQTPSFPAGSDPDFINAACAFHSALSAPDTLAALHQIEADFGRERRLRWGQRTLDLDLIAHGDKVLPDMATQNYWRTLPPERQKNQTPDALIVPHPRVQDRAFVLVPLADVAADWVHPLLGQKVTEMLSRLPASERADIKLL